MDRRVVWEGEITLAPFTGGALPARVCCGRAQDDVTVEVQRVDALGSPSWMEPGDPALRSRITRRALSVLAWRTQPAFLVGDVVNLADGRQGIVRVLEPFVPPAPPAPAADQD